MTIADRWLLPDGIDEVLPPEARQLEALRRRLLDVFDRWGYDLVFPPGLEYLESLLTGTGKDLDLRTFKVTDQLSGRMMGLSADTTPQVARIDAHSLAPEGVSRLSYCRTVFHAKASSLLASRTPTQIGAELYGESGLAADVEIISLMLAMLASADVADVHLDLGHVGVFRALTQAAELSELQQTELFELLRLKCASDIDAWGEKNLPSTDLQRAFALLTRLQGDRSVVEQAQAELAALVPAAGEALTHLLQVSAALAVRFPELDLYFDLTELRGYDYHTGLLFAAYVPGYGDAVAKGGRYDETGAVFGRARPATGFSADLKVITRFGQWRVSEAQTVLAPNDADPELWQQIAELRDSGYRVVLALDTQPSTQVDFHLSKQDGQWQLIPATN